MTRIRGPRYIPFLGEKQGVRNRVLRDLAWRVVAMARGWDV